MRGEVILVLGGARSGKSAWAERLATESGRRVLYVATATAGDAEMAERIAAHQARRPAAWRTVEAPDGLQEAVLADAGVGESVVVDCLTLWVSNVILAAIGHGRDPADVVGDEWAAIEGRLLADVEALVVAARERDLALILVSNEVGMGLVPPFPLGRRYRDILGRVNQAVAAAADSVVLLIAGLPVDLRRLLYAQSLATSTDRGNPTGREREGRPSSGL